MWLVDFEPLARHAWSVEKLLPQERMRCFGASPAANGRFGGSHVKACNLPNLNGCLSCPVSVPCLSQLIL